MQTSFLGLLGFVALHRDLLLEAHNLSDGQVSELDPAHAFRADDRLVKTLLRAALGPCASPLKSLDVAKLTALNHGSIVSPIPGGEKGMSQNGDRWYW